jgi:DNA-binding Xre family transcriptional regulator
MTTKMGYRWLLRERMAERNLWKTTELAPLLADRGIHLSSTQIYRLVTATPERLSLPLLAALCDILACEPNDLIETFAIAKPKSAAAGENLGAVLDMDRTSRPRRARVDPTTP